MSYIERKTALKFVRNNTPHINGETTMKCVARAIKEVPTADVVEVVRCKDCIYNSNGSCTHSEIYDDLNYNPDYYCADGERREE